jgi:hypothetical protein
MATNDFDGRLTAEEIAAGVRDWQIAEQLLKKRASWLAGAAVDGPTLRAAMARARREYPMLAASESVKAKANQVRSTSPDGPETGTRWAMHDVFGNLIVGSTKPGVPATLVLRDLTPREAGGELNRLADDLVRERRYATWPEAWAAALDLRPDLKKIYAGAPRA